MRYPFGLTMAGISSKAAGGIENKRKFNDATELENNEFSNGVGLDWYATTFRSQDPQLGRFWQLDPLADYYSNESPYNYASNNPIYYNDPLGLFTNDPGFNAPANTPVDKLPWASDGVVVTSTKRKIVSSNNAQPVLLPENKARANGYNGVSNADNTVFNVRNIEINYPRLPKKKQAQGGGGMKPASAYDYSQDVIPGKFTDDWNYITGGSDGNPFSRAWNIFSRDWGQASTADKANLALAAFPLIRIGKIAVPAQTFHRVIKPDILKAAGNGFEKIVGRNPDIFIDKGQIILRGTGPFKGKSFPTGLDPTDFFH